jgi:osmoprotectant transport system substrate-binding protein
LKAGDVQVIQYGTTGPELADGSFVALEDDKGLLSADPVVPLIRDEIADQKLIDALNSLSAELTTEDLAKWNKSTELDKEEPADVATAWLQDKGLD